MKSWVGLCFVVVCGIGAWGQAPELAHRPAVVVEKPGTAPPPPPPMTAPAQLEPARLPNANGIYQSLRQRTPNGASFSVKDLTLKRDAAIITLASGNVYLYGPVNGATVGAVFIGDGMLHIQPPSAMERRQLKAVMKTEVLDQRFTTAVFAFTDGTAAELQKASTGVAQPAGEAFSLANDVQTIFRRTMKYDLEARLLEDISLPSGTGGFFLASMKGPMFSKRLIYVFDPRGAIGSSPEEVSLLTSADDDFDVTLGFHSIAQRQLKTPADNHNFKIPQQTIDVTIEKNGKLTGTAVTSVKALAAGVQVLPLQMFPTLRVSGVWGPQGEALDFIQEDKLHDADFAVILKKPLAAGESTQITTTYAGKDAVSDEGANNFFLVAREDWYPNMRGTFGNYAFYTMTFHTPKLVQVVATGNRVSDKEDAKGRTAVWRSLAPMPVAGFNLGEFKIDQSERNKDVQVISYANTALASRYEGLTNMPGLAVGTMSTTGMLKRATSEGDAAIQIYTDFFGPLSYDHVALTEQTACNYGQSWPMLVYLPICYFWDSTIQHQLGILDSDPSYWQVVTAHEVAHQWWGQTVGFASYRDQWMSEGFANLSAAIFLMQTRKDMKEYRDFWELLRRRLLEKNKEGFRPVDVGPVTMGARVSTSKTGYSVYQNLIYPKGAYILHMLEMLFWSPDKGEALFKIAMHDFVNSYRNQPATTEDFKAIMEKDMPSWADLDRNHKLDWFFDAYVYGTEVPKYTTTSEFTKVGDETKMHFTLTQSGVSDSFRMIIPLYLEMEDKRVIQIGRIGCKGPKTLDQTVNLGKLQGTPKRLVVNYNFDLLTD